MMGTPTLGIAVYRFEARMARCQARISISEYIFLSVYEMTPGRRKISEYLISVMSLTKNKRV